MYHIWHSHLVFLFPLGVTEKDVKKFRSECPLPAPPKWVVGVLEAIILCSWFTLLCLLPIPFPLLLLVICELLGVFSEEDGVDAILDRLEQQNS